MGMNGWLAPEPQGWQEHVRLALEEDLGWGDPSSAIFGESHRSEWVIEAQEEGVICGVGVAAHLLGEPDDITHEVLAVDGQSVRPGDLVMRGCSTTWFILGRERTALNYLMHLSGIATLTKRFVELVAPHGAKVVDTRKTVPGLRHLAKYAVRCGGGSNHRMGLGDGVMLKDNHIRAAGSIREAVRRARELAPHTLRIEVECETFDMVREAVDSGAEVVMLDNMEPELMRSVVEAFGSKVLLEASGGVDLESIERVARTGVHLISVGAITHSAPALRLHLEFL